MISATSCYRIGDRYDDFTPALEDENEPADGLEEDAEANYYLRWVEELSIEDLTEWADRQTAPAYFAALSYEYACPSDFRFVID